MKLYISNNTMPRVNYPTPIPAKVSGYSVWSRSVMLRSAERWQHNHTWNSNYFQCIPTYVTMIPQRHRQTGQMADVTISL